MKKNTVEIDCYDVVVIGGGPAGMMAAAEAARRGRSVLLLEKNAGVGKKLLITGGGRCNVTNNKPDVRTMLAQYRDAGKFLFSAFAQHAVVDTVDWFNERGVALNEENEGRLFPVSNSAQTIWDTLVREMVIQGVIVRTRSAVTQIQKTKTDKQFTITLVSGEQIMATSCVVATGGVSRPETGSTGEGLRWLGDLGHTVVPNSYALVPLASSDGWIKPLAGVVLPAVKIAVYADGKKHSVHTGKLLFTHVGISGPTILNMSKAIGDLLSHSTVTLRIDVVPQFDAGVLKVELQNLLTTASNKKLKNVLSELIGAALVGPLLSLVPIDGEIPCHSIRAADRSKLAQLLKAVPLHISGLLGAEKAVVSAGGVVPSQVQFKTMESRIVPGLYVVGDAININRPSGGYSLQLCWTTGIVAGSHC